MIDPQCVDALVWGVRQTFRDYVAGVSDGVEELDDGLVADPEGRFVFPRILGEDLAFSGEVRMRAHRGMLSVRLARPSLAPSNGGWSVSILHPRGARNPEYGRQVVAHFDADDICTVESGWTARPRLTADGASLFGGNYEVGAPLDPMLLRADLAPRSGRAPVTTGAASPRGLGA